MQLQPNPYIHRDPTQFYNPATHLTLRAGEPLFDSLLTLLDGGFVTDGAMAQLEADEWLIRDVAAAARRSSLRIVSLETNSACNQACYFCPVSIDPRENTVMSDQQFTNIVEQLTGYRSSLDGVFLQSYNEPTADRRFVDHCRVLKQAGLPVAVLSNASGLLPAKVDQVLEFGPLRYLCINLSTLDRELYQRDRGRDHLPRVMENVDYVADKPFAEQMKIVVLGKGDAEHDASFSAVSARYGGSRFAVERHVVMDRAGYLEVGLRMSDEPVKLRGCDNLGSRPIQHLHITAGSKCVLCCEDYDENYVVGDLHKQTIAEVLAGPELTKFRSWAYGVEEAPEDFICRKCIFARVER